MHEKRFFRALFKSLITFSVLHIILLTVLAITTQRMEYLNVFEIIGLSHYFPGIEKGFVSFLASTGIIIGVYFLYYHRSKRKTNS